MNNSKVWLVLGAAEGLGPATVSYLLTNKQFVIPVDTSQQLPLADEIPHLTDACGPLDFIINNSNYNLFNRDLPDINECVIKTADLLRALVLSLRHEPRGSIINIPPQLCLATIPDQVYGRKLLKDMDTFLTALRLELTMLDCGLHFLEPGERLPQL